MQNVVITQTAREMLRGVHKLTTLEGWNYGLDNIRAIYDADPLGSFCAVDSKGEIVGHLLSARISDKLVMGGLFIVRADMRGQGIGKQLFERRVGYVGDSNFGVNVGAHHYQTHQNLYGAGLHAFDIIGYTGKRGPLIKATDKYKILPLAKVDFGDMVKYDTNMCYGMKRPHFLNRWIAGLVSRTVVAVDDDEVVGYATLRPADDGFRIAPIYGNNPDILYALYRRITQHHTSEEDTILMNVPVTNDAFVHLCKDMDFKQSYLLRRMFTKEIVMPPLDKIGSLMTMEVTLC